MIYSRPRSSALAWPSSHAHVSLPPLRTPRANFRPRLQRTRPWRPGLAQLEQHSTCTCTCHMPHATGPETANGGWHGTQADERHMRHTLQHPTVVLIRPAPPAL
eukprot:scaffold3460_cov115-Isochrysis_galbana.AAC.10